MNIKKYISNNIRLLMEQKGIRAWSELAKLCNLTVPAMQRLINQDTESPGIKSLKAIADFFEISVDRLISPSLSQSLSYFAGVFSDGSRTFCRIEDQTGKTLGLGESDSSNIAFSINLAWDSVTEAIKSAMSNGNLNINMGSLSVGAGIKGTELSEALTKLIRIGETNFKQFKIFSDGYVSYCAVFSEKPGILIIVDEGVVGYASNKEGGECRKIGGWGFPQADAGGAAWIGAQAINHAFRVYDKIEEKSSLSEAIFSRFHYSGSSLCEFIVNHSAPRDFAEFYDLVIDHYKSKDKVAVKIIQQAVSIISELIEKFDLLNEDSSYPVCFDGKMKYVLDMEYKEKERLIQTNLHLDDKAKVVIKLLQKSIQ